jgi:two-component system response regulator AtoC
MLASTKHTKSVAAAAAGAGDSNGPDAMTPQERDDAATQVALGPPPPRGRTPEADGAARLQQVIALWRSPKMREIWEIIQQAARADVTVLLRGETGTGKDLVARLVHHLSPRKDRPFVKVNCAAVPRELLETELFGHERGAFTGAHQLKIGKFESANHGTAFLDEIGDLHPTLQGKLLHVLQDGEFSRVGARATIKADVRIIAATNQDLERAVGNGAFRDDLYYRLNVIQIVLPPLRERREEIPWLVKHFVERYSAEFHRETFAVSPSVLQQLVRYSFPGNIRELENIVKRMIVLNKPWISPDLLQPAGDDDDGQDALSPPAAQTPSLKDVAREAARVAEREVIAKALEQTGWNRVRAAQLLRISYRALLYKMKDSGLSQRPEPAPPALS